MIWVFLKFWEVISYDITLSTETTQRVKNVAGYSTSTVVQVAFWMIFYFPKKNLKIFWKKDNLFFPIFSFISFDKFSKCFGV